MKAKYQHEANRYLIYDYVICEENIVITIRLHKNGWINTPPQTTTNVCLTNAEARRLFFNICDKFEKERYDCEYREDYE